MSKPRKVFGRKRERVEWKLSARRKQKLLVRERCSCGFEGNEVGLAVITRNDYDVAFVEFCPDCSKLLQPHIVDRRNKRLMRFLGRDEITLQDLQAWIDEENIVGEYHR